MKYSLDYKEEVRILKKRGYSQEFLKDENGNKILDKGLWFINIDNGTKIQLHHDHGRIDYVITDKLYQDWIEIRDILSNLPFKRVYPYSVNSSNHTRISAIYNYMVKHNISIFDKDAIDRLCENKNFRHLIQLIIASYPDETTITLLAMFCKLSCLCSQAFSLHWYGSDEWESKLKADPEYNEREYKLGCIGMDTLTADHASLHQLMKFRYVSWQSAWKNLRALGQYFHPRIPIHKDMVVLSKKASSLLTKRPDLDPEDTIYTDNLKTGDYEGRPFKEVCPWLFRDKT